MMGQKMTRPCGDCDDGYCTMNCGPAIPPKNSVADGIGVPPAVLTGSTEAREDTGGAHDQQGQDMTLRNREQHRQQFSAMLKEHGIDRQEAATMLHSSVDRIIAWLKPETSKSSNPVPLWAIELLEFKLGLRKAERRKP